MSISERCALSILTRGIQNLTREEQQKAFLEMQCLPCDDDCVLFVLAERAGRIVARMYAASQHKAAMQKLNEQFNELPALSKMSHGIYECLKPAPRKVHKKMLRAVHDELPTSPLLRVKLAPVVAVKTKHRVDPTNKIKTGGWKCKEMSEDDAINKRRAYQREYYRLVHAPARKLKIKARQKAAEENKAAVDAIMEPI